MPHRDQINSESAINWVSEHQRELECVNSCNCTVGRSRETKKKKNSNVDRRPDKKKPSISFFYDIFLNF